MSTKSNVINKKEHMEGILRGIKVATNLIRTTYGPKGLNISVENEFYPFSQTANDAQTIIQAIRVEGVSENRGLNYLKELMDKINSLSADGRKTTAIILEEILERSINSNLSGMELKRSFDELIPLIEQKIDEQRQTITEDGIEKVATIAGESKEIGTLLGEIYRRIGKDGIIIPESSSTYQTSCSFIEGVRFVDTGYLSPYMVHDEQAVKDGQKETKALYENPTILVTKKKISHLNDINPLLERLTDQGKKDLIIFTDDMDSGVASILVKAHKDKIMNILIIKAPTLWKGIVFEDFAKVTSSTIVEDASGINFKNLKLEHLGTCGKITVDKEETTIVGIADISDHIASLKAENSEESKLRLSWLATKTAILRLGANSESELSYKRLKCYDAINSSRSALKEGVVHGGGLALFEASQGLPDTVVGNILKESLRAPNKQIQSEPMEIKQDVLDSVVVVKNAVRNAIALASTILTLGGDVAIPPKSAEQIAEESLKNKGMRF